MNSWNCHDMCDDGIDQTLERLICDLSSVFGQDTIKKLYDMVEDRALPFKILVNTIGERMEEIKHYNDCDGYGCDDCDDYAVQIEDLENEVKELREHPTLNWQGRTLEYRRDNVFVDIRTGDAFKLTPSMELVSICQ